MFQRARFKIRLKSSQSRLNRFKKNWTNKKEVSGTACRRELLREECSRFVLPRAAILLWIGIN